MRFVLAAAMAAWTLSVGVAHADGDPANGEKVFAKCKSCHMVGEGAKTRVGPVLNGVVGNAWGKAEGFKYSPALMELAATGRVWDEATLDAYLKKPKEIIPRGRMSFPGLNDAAQRADVIAYLKKFNANGTVAK
jgi:cytochrome c